jgi:uncharacterized protein (DUF1697 family)
MNSIVFLVRGINVSGHNPLKMDKLLKLCETLGFTRVRTYLQSGNVVCGSRNADAEKHARALGRRILRDCGFEVKVMARTAAALSAVVEANPFAGLPSIEPKFMHATFLAGPPGASSLEGTDLPLAPGERAVLVGDMVYLYCPRGYGRSKITNAFFEKKLGRCATTRNWKTVTALEGMARLKTN